MKLIKEVAQELNYLVEDKQGGGKNVFIEGIFAQADTQNKNKRIYGKPIISTENLLNRKDL
jgi:hypothetical protein